jgi:hypothetical protein
MTAAHVLEGVDDGMLLSAGVSGNTGPSRSHEIDWWTTLPNSDIAVMRVRIGESPCLPIRFREVNLSETIGTTGIAECMLEKEPDGATSMMQRAAKGYVAYGMPTWVAASFALPAGMSGSPAVLYADDGEYVVGVLVGQSRSEIDEHLVKEFTEVTSEGRSTQVEKISRVEYAARVDVLAHHKDFRAEEFGGRTLSELIALEKL